MPENYPNTLGHEAGFTNYEFVWNTIRYTGIKSVSYRHTSDFEPAEGTPNQPLGWPEGAYRGGEGAFTMLRKTFDQMTADMGDGYMTQIFDILAHLAPAGGPITTDTMGGCKISEEAFEGERGGDSLYVERSFKFLYLLPNGVKPVANMVT